jgi:hypothetical protein
VIHDAAEADVAPDAAKHDACTIDCTPESIPAPRPIAPLSTSTATSQQPTLRWMLPKGEDGAWVEICMDRECAVPVTSFVGSGASGAPPMALAKGVYFWRLRGRANGLIGTAFSPTWELWVGVQSAPIDSSWGTTPDVDGDGFPEVIVGAFGADSYLGAAYLYEGSASGPAATPTTLSSPAIMDALFGTSVASAGDVNGDGFADVVVGARGISGQNLSGAAYVYLGGPGGLSSSATSLQGPAIANSAFGASVASAGDVNRDGYADVVVGAYGEGAGFGGAAYVYLGGPNGISATGTPLVDPGGGGLFGISVAGAGDVNGDGFGDVLVGANREGTGAVYLYLGGPEGPSATPVRIPSPVASTGGMLVNFGYSVSSAGDVDGDGLADVVIGSATFINGGGAFVYLGTPGGIASAPTALGSGGVETLFFGESVSVAGDVNADGFADVVVSNGANQVVASVFVFLGGPSGVSASPVGYAYLDGTLGTVVAGAGDVDNDGFADFLAGAPYGGAGNGVGAVTLFFGDASGFSMRAPLSIVNPTGTYGQFGCSLQ